MGVGMAIEKVEQQSKKRDEALRKARESPPEARAYAF